jgi:hypothetical protein
MKRLIIAYTLMALTGCSYGSVGELDREGTTTAYDVRGQAVKVAECVTAALDANDTGMMIQRTRNLSDGSAELLGSDHDLRAVLMWRAVFKPTGPGSTRVELTTKDFPLFMSADSIRAHLQPVFTACSAR